MNITTKEASLLSDIYNSEYQDGERAGNKIWLDYVLGSKSRGGVLTSLQAKGLVGVKIVAKAVSDNRQNGISDSTVWLTEAGVAAFKALKG